MLQSRNYFNRLSLKDFSWKLTKYYVMLQGLKVWLLSHQVRVEYRAKLETYFQMQKWENGICHQSSVLYEMGECLGGLPPIKFELNIFP